MAIPANYTDSTLAAYMHYLIGDHATNLAFVVGTSYAEAINDVLVMASATTVESIAPVKCRLLAAVAAWKLVLSRLSDKYALSADGISLQRQQAFDMVKKNLADAEREAANAGYATTGATVTRTEVEYRNDPYAAVSYVGDIV